MSNKLSRERKVIIGILGVALAGLAADRLFFSSGLTGPAEASAAAGEFAVDASLEALVEEIDAEPALIPERTESITATLAGQFEEYARQGSPDVTGLSDVFRPSDSWLQTSDAPDGVARTISAADEFGVSHTLSAVIMSRSNPGAVVNRQLITIGQEIDGFVLVSVNERSAIFEARDEQAILTLDGRTDPSS